MRARRPPGDNTGHTKSAGKGPSWSHRSEVVWGAHSESVLESLGMWPGSAQHWQLSALLPEQQLMLVLCFHVSTETSCSFLMRPQPTQQDRQDGSHASAVGATTFPLSSSRTGLSVHSSSPPAGAFRFGLYKKPITAGCL